MNLLNFLKPFLALTILTYYTLAAEKERTVNFQNLQIVDIDDLDAKHILTTPMQPIVFPLSEEDKQVIEILKRKVIDLNAAGLAASQLGIRKPITVFHVPEFALKYREDITEIIPLTVLINPSYTPLEDKGKTLDWEGCFSAKNHYGKIARYTAIDYERQDENGNRIKGTAYGFLARLLQHEIDHCNGKMCINSYDSASPKGSRDDLSQTRNEALIKRKRELGIPEEGNFPLMKIKD